MPEFTTQGFATFHQCHLNESTASQQNKFSSPLTRLFAQSHTSCLCMDGYEKLPLMVKFSDILETIEVLQFQYDKQHNGVNFSIMLVF